MIRRSCLLALLFGLVPLSVGCLRGDVGEGKGIFHDPDETPSAVEDMSAGPMEDMASDAPADMSASPVDMVRDDVPDQKPDEVCTLSCGDLGECVREEDGERCMCDEGAEIVNNTCQRCEGERCERECLDQGLSECSDQCVDTADDVLHCGGCDKPCEDLAGAMTSCERSMCEYVCEDGLGDCNDDMELDGCEQELTTDDHCGMCGKRCPTEMHASSGCVEGGCAPLACDYGWLDCNDDLGAGGDGCETQANRCGGIDWIFTFGTQFNDTPSANGAYVDVAMDSADNVVAAFVNGPGNQIGMQAYPFDRAGSLVLSIDTAGQLRWATAFHDQIMGGVFGDVVVTRVITDPATDDVFVVGTGFGERLEIDGVPIEAINSNCSSFAARLDGATGAHEWVKIIRDASCSELRAATITADGLLVGGRFEGTMMLGDRSVTATGPSDAFFATLDLATGDVKSGAAVAGTGFEWMRDLVELPGGDIVFAGEFSNTNTTLGGTMLTMQGSNDAMVVRVTPSGQVVWAKGWGTMNGEYANEIELGPSGRVYVSGTYDATITIGGTTLTGSSIGLWLSRIDPATGDSDWVIGTQDAGNSLYYFRSDIEVDANEVVHFGFHMNVSGATKLGGEFLSGGLEGVLARVDGATGTVLSIEDFETTGGVLHFVGFALDAAGIPAIAGYFTQGTTLDNNPLNSAGDIDHVVIKLD